MTRSTRIYLHVVDTVGVVHAIILRAQALLLPVKTLFCRGTDYRTGSARQDLGGAGAGGAGAGRAGGRHGARVQRSGISKIATKSALSLGAEEAPSTRATTVQRPAAKDPDEPSDLLSW